MFASYSLKKCLRILLLLFISFNTNIVVAAPQLLEKKRTLTQQAAALREAKDKADEAASHQRQTQDALRKAQQAAEADEAPAQ